MKDDRIEKDEKCLYSSRKFIAKDSVPSTASICTFAGKTKWRSDLDSFDNFYVEISDCNGKIRLHKSNEESVTDWINKLKVLKDELNNYVEFVTKEIKTSDKESEKRM